MKKGDGTLTAMPGILHARAAHDHFRYAQAQPAAGLTPFVEHYWIVRWDLTGRDPYTQWVLPYPSVNITFTPGRSRVAGVPRGRFSEVLTGAGRVFGARFRPEGLRVPHTPESAATNLALLIWCSSNPAMQRRSRR